MIEAFCINCGHGETDDTVHRKERKSSVRDGIDTMESKAVETHFHCDECGIDEVIDKGVLAIKATDNFDLRERPVDNGLAVTVDSKSIEFTDIDEQIATSTHYTTAGARSTSRVHIVHVHAVNPPTLSKGSHNVQIGEYLDEEMTLTDIRYRDNKRRTLKFQRDLSSNVQSTDSPIPERTFS